jgi:putative transposase
MTAVLNRLTELPANMSLLSEEDQISWPEKVDIPINHKRTRRLMQEMGYEAIYRKPNLSGPGRGLHKKYPYLLRNMAIDHPNKVWRTDITYIPMRQGRLYLCAVSDWHSRLVLAYRLSNTMDADFCIDALTESINAFGTPEIFNSDQGSQFTSEEFFDILISHGIRISLDGRGRALDNVIAERFWRSLKYEEVFLHDYADVKEARERIDNYVRFYNTSRPHQSLSYAVPAEIYQAGQASNPKATFPKPGLGGGPDNQQNIVTGQTTK